MANVHMHFIKILINVAVCITNSKIIISFHIPGDFLIVLDATGSFS